MRRFGQKAEETTPRVDAMYQKDYGEGGNVYVYVAEGRSHKRVAKIDLNRKHCGASTGLCDGHVNRMMYLPAKKENGSS